MILAALFEKLDGVVIGRVRLSREERWREVVRLGTPKAKGGTGTKWACNCPDRAFPCAHLKQLWSRQLPAGCEELTDEGRAIVCGSVVW